MYQHMVIKVQSSIELQVMVHRSEDVQCPTNGDPTVIYYIIMKLRPTKIHIHHTVY